MSWNHSKRVIKMLYAWNFLLKLPLKSQENSFLPSLSFFRFKMRKKQKKPKSLFCKVPVILSKYTAKIGCASNIFVGSCGLRKGSFYQGQGPYFTENLFYQLSSLFIKMCNKLLFFRVVCSWHYKMNIAVNDDFTCLAFSVVGTVVWRWGIGRRWRHTSVHCMLVLKKKKMYLLEVFFLKWLL